MSRFPARICRSVDLPGGVIAFGARSSTAREGMWGGGERQHRQRWFGFLSRASERKGRTCAVTADEQAPGTLWEVERHLLEDRSRLDAVQLRVAKVELVHPDREVAHLACLDALSPSPVQSGRWEREKDGGEVGLGSRKMTGSLGPSPGYDRPTGVAVLALSPPKTASAKPCRSPTRCTLHLVVRRPRTLRLRLVMATRAHRSRYRASSAGSQTHARTSTPSWKRTLTF